MGRTLACSLYTSSSFFYAVRTRQRLTGGSRGGPLLLSRAVWPFTGISGSFPLLSLLSSCYPLSRSQCKSLHMCRHRRESFLAGDGRDRTDAPFSSVGRLRWGTRERGEKHQRRRAKSLSGRDESSGSSRREDDSSFDEQMRGRDGWDTDEEGMSLLAADLESMRAQEERTNRSASYSSARSRAADADGKDGYGGIGFRGGGLTTGRSGGMDVTGKRSAESGGDGWKDLLDKALVVDFFFVCVALLWLVGGLTERAAFNRTALIETWWALWTPVFQPALGVLMAGALVSGAAGYLKSKEEK